MAARFTTATGKEDWRPRVQNARTCHPAFTRKEQQQATSNETHDAKVAVAPRQRLAPTDYAPTGSRYGYAIRHTDWASEKTTVEEGIDEVSLYTVSVKDRHELVDCPNSSIRTPLSSTGEYLCTASFVLRRDQRPSRSNLCSR